MCVCMCVREDGECVGSRDEFKESVIWREMHEMTH